MAQKIEWDIPDILVDMDGNDAIYYENNKNLKKADVQLPYSAEHIKEFIKCKEDVFYFAEKYYHIKSLDEGILKIKLRDYQKQMLASFVDHRNSVVNATRQCVSEDTTIRVRNKKTGEIKDIEIGDFYNQLNHTDT